MTERSQDPIWADQELRADAVIVRIGGEVSPTTIAKFTRFLHTAATAANPPAPVIVDLTGIEFFGSGGLGALLTHHHACTERGSHLTIVADHPTVLRAITLTGLDTTLHVVATLNDATTPNTIQDASLDTTGRLGRHHPSG